MIAEIISLISVIIAFTAVLVAVWQARRAARAEERMRSLSIISETFGEWRSAEFRKHRSVLLSLAGTMPPEGGFEALPRNIRESAYAWCFYCDYLGHLVLYKIVPEELIIDFMGTQLPQLWGILEPFIEKEREHRLKTLPEGIPTGFLGNYEHLVARIVAHGGRTAVDKIRETYSAQRLSPEALRMLTPRSNSSGKKRHAVRGWRRYPTKLEPHWQWFLHLLRWSDT